MIEMPNIKIQRQGPEMPGKRKWLLPAADLERYADLLPFITVKRDMPLYLRKDRSRVPSLSQAN